MCRVIRKRAYLEKQAERAPVPRGLWTHCCAPAWRQRRVLRVGASVARVCTQTDKDGEPEEQESARYSPPVQHALNGPENMSAPLERETPWF